MKTKLIKAVLAFLTGREDQLNTDSKSIGEKILDAPAYAGLNPTPADGKKIIDAYSDALSEAKRNGVAKTAFKNQKKSELQDLMRIWASQVSVISNGSMEIFAQSGFTPRSTNVKPYEVTTPGSPKVANGVNEGHVNFSTRAMRGAHSYTFRYSVVNPAIATAADWVVLDPSPTRSKAKGLTVGQTIYVCVRANGVLNVSDFSEPTVFRVGIEVPKPKAAKAAKAA